MQAFIDIMKTNFGKVGGDIVVSEEEQKMKAELEKQKLEMKQKEQMETENALTQVHNKRSEVWHEPLKRRDGS